MQVCENNEVRIYNVTSGKSIPEVNNYNQKFKFNKKVGFK